MRVVICDLDGTLIYENLENLFVKFLLSKKKLRYKIILISLFTLPFNLLRNKLYYPSIFKSWTYVLKENFDEYKEEFLNQTQIHINEDVIALIKKIAPDKTILLTGSYQNLAIAYLKKSNIDIFNEVIGSKVKNNYFTLERHPYGKGKVKFVNDLNYNIGIANEYSDHYYLDLCDEKYYIKLR